MAKPELAGPLLEHGQFCWTEIAGTDLDKSVSFYSNVFGWSIDRRTSAEDGSSYLEFSSSGEKNPDGAIYQMGPERFGGHMPPPHFMTYVTVHDVDTAAQQAEDLGASVLRAPMDIPNVGRMAVLRDPTGAVFSIFSPVNVMEGNDR